MKLSKIAGAVLSLGLLLNALPSSAASPPSACGR